MRRVIVVAHPDDETLWAGGLAARLRCHIIACSIPKRDPIRAEQFMNAVKILGCTGEVLPCIENPPAPLDLSLLDLELYDHIITHNRLAEYGHAHHLQLHRHIKNKYTGKKISFFGYGLPNNEIISVNMTDDEYVKKIKALQCYNHVLPYRGRTIQKSEALIDRYFHGQIQNLKNEGYSGEILQ